MDNSTIKPSLGNPARGEAFYPREREINKIFRVLESNASIYLSAPRRVGKTSILKHLEDMQDADGYYFIYVITESVYSINEFFKVLYETVLKSKAVQNLSKVSKAITSFLQSTLSYVEEIPGVVKLKELPEADYHQLFMELLDKIEKGVGRVVIMVDEFPQTIHNIYKKHGIEEARKFIQLERVARHRKQLDANVSFIYTGSISLFPMVERIGSLTDVNDLQPIVVKPLSRKEAVDLLTRLCNRSKIAVEASAIEYLLDTIKWYVPFHIQLIHHEMDDIYNGVALTDNDIQTAIDNTIDAKNKARFDPYFSRLKALLEKEEYLFAIEVLKHAAAEDTIDDAVIFDKSVKYSLDNHREIVDQLCEDGYLFRSENQFIYTSPILQLWCKKFN